MGHVQGKLRWPDPTAAASSRGRRDRQGRVVGEHRLVQATQVRAGVDAQLVDQHPPRALVGLERIRLATAAVQRQHQQRPILLPQRILIGQRPQLGHHLGVAAERKVGLDAALQGTQALLDQLRNHVALQHLRRHIRQRHPTPQRQRLPQQPRVRLPVTRTGRLARLLKQDLEAADVDVATRCRQHVPARPTLQHLLEGEALP